MTDDQIKRGFDRRQVLLGGAATALALTLGQPAFAQAAPKKGGRFRLGVSHANTGDSHDPATWGTSAIVNVGLNLILIPRWGGTGAAVATLLSQALAGWLSSFCSQRVRPIGWMQARALLAPFFLASESPIAIACLRLLTRPPRPPGPLRSVPRFLRRIALATVRLAAVP